MATVILVSIQSIPSGENYFLLQKNSLQVLEPSLAAPLTSMDQELKSLKSHGRRTQLVGRQLNSRYSQRGTGGDSEVTRH